MPVTHHRRRLIALLATTALLLGVTAACSPEVEPIPPAPQPSPTQTGEQSLTFGVFGSSGEVAGYRLMANSFGEAEVKLLAWADGDEASRAFRSGMDLPDVFLLPRGSLGWFLDREMTQPVDELLDERGINFGDAYNRDAVRAFAADDALQCMPFSLSPMVIYYNTDLIDFDRMAARGLDVPEPGGRWSMDQFEEAARFASRPRRGTKGVWIEPTLRGLAPFILSGDGKIFDDELDPTSLAFSSEETQAALSTTLELLRNPQLTPTRDQLRRQPALEMFEQGKLGMVAGFRSLTPRFRQVPTLNFDVMPMPTLDTSATIGEFVGLCISADAGDPSLAADFLVHSLSADAVAQVTRAGYVVPADVAVAASEDFLQPGQQPVSAHVFTDSIREIELLPMLDSWSRLHDAVGASTEDLVHVPVLDLPALTERIDAESVPVLSPQVPSESASSSASPTE